MNDQIPGKEVIEEIQKKPVRDVATCSVKIRIAGTGCSIAVPKTVLQRILAKHGVTIDKITERTPDGKYKPSPELEKILENYEAVWIYDDFEGFHLLIRPKHP